jgi:hypothetical protein
MVNNKRRECISARHVWRRTDDKRGLISPDAFCVCMEKRFDDLPDGSEYLVDYTNSEDDIMFGIGDVKIKTSR